MSISDGEKVNAAASNAAWMSRKVDTDTLGVVGLQNTANPDSGSTITNTQRAINKSFDTSGITDEADATAKTYSSTNYVANGDDRKVAIGKLDAQVGTNAGDLTTHIADTTTHGTTGAIVGISDTQTLTNKTIDADNNSISNLEHGAEVDNPSSGVHGVVGSVVGTSDTQTLTNKTFDDEVTVKEIVTPSTPASGYQAIYPKSDGNWYTIDDSGSETQVGAGAGGAAGINYVEQWDFEDGLISDWTDNSVSVTLSLESTSPLIGTYSLKAAKSAASANGTYVSNAIVDIDPMFETSMMTVEFYYETTANFVSGDMEVEVYDVENSNAIYAGTLTGPRGKFTGDIQTAPFGGGANEGKYRVRLKYATTNANAYDIVIDNVIFGPQKSVATGPAGWEQYALTVTGTNWTTTKAVGVPYKTLDGTWRMTLSVGGLFSSATGESSVYITGVAFNSFSNNGRQALAVSTPLIRTTANEGATVSGSGEIRLSSAGTTTEWVVSGDVELTNQPTFAIDYSNLQLSSTTQNRQIFTRISSSGGNLAPNSSYVKVPYDTIEIDKTNVFNTTLDRWDIEEDGTYRLKALLDFNSTNVLNNVYQLAIYINGSYSKNLSETKTPAATSRFGLDGEWSGDLERGDYIETYLYGGGNNSSNQLSAFGASSSFAVLEKINTGSQTIAATESIYVDGAGNAGTTITASVTNIDFTEINDSHGAWNGTQFTTPADGRYLIDGMVLSTIASVTDIRAYIGGVANIGLNTNVSSVQHLIGGTITLEKGNILSLRSSAGITLSNNPNFHHLSITRLK